MILSLLIMTMPSRKGKVEALISTLSLCEVLLYNEEAYELGVLRRWVDNEKGVEILAYETAPYDKANPDDRLSYGGKRNALMAAAKGDYVAAIDDDDQVHPEYIDKILKALESNPDVVGFKVACYGYAHGCTRPDIMEPADVSIRYNGWANNVNGFTYVRYPHHLAPTKREYAMAIGYRGHYGEDHDYSVRMQAAGLLKTEAYIDEWMYTYLFNSKKKPGE